MKVEGLSLGNRLTGIDADMRLGAVTAICGPNGAGKSTLLACLAGLIRPDAGCATIHGEDVMVMAPRTRARAIGYLPQAPEIAWDLSVETLVMLGRLPWRGGPASEATEAVEQAIVAMDLGSLRYRPVSKLSGGERARALMARVLAGKPHWLLADEPLANLDLAHAASLVARFRETARAGAGVVLVLHDLATAMNHADHVLVLDKGALVQAGPPQAALSEDVIASVWGVKAHWLGEAGTRALSLA
jgi:iron complex transport system ATP-binding protein